jgi:hypothetical protein
MGKKINLNDIARRQRAEAERERRKAEAERVAGIEERCLKRVLGAAIEHGNKMRSPSSRWIHGYGNDCPRPHPNNAGRKPIKSPAGEAADKGRKWGGGVCLCLGASKPGSGDSGNPGRADKQKPRRANVGAFGEPARSARLSCQIFL